MLKVCVLSVLFGVSVAYMGRYEAIDVPIKSYDSGIKVIPSPSHYEKKIAEVKVGPVEMPVHMTFKSKTSPIYVDQKHKKTKGSYKKSTSEDEPHKLVHEVVKPVYQEIKEIIKPYRKVVQVIEPIQEERLTKVYKDSHSQGYSSGHNNGYDSGHNNQYNNGNQNNGNHYNGNQPFSHVYKQFGAYHD